MPFEVSYACGMPSCSLVEFTWSILGEIFSYGTRADVPIGASNLGMPRLLTGPPLIWWSVLDVHSVLKKNSPILKPSSEMFWVCGHCQSPFDTHLQSWIWNWSFLYIHGSHLLSSMTQCGNAFHSHILSEWTWLMIKTKAMDQNSWMNMSFFPLSYTPESF